MTKDKLIKKLIRLFDGLNRFLPLDRLIGRVLAHSPKNVVSQIIQSGDYDLDESSTWIVGTSAKGLLLIDHHGIHQINKARKFYGITRIGSRWFAYQENHFTGTIISFQLRDRKMVDVKVHIHGLPRGIHQIDYWADQLYVLDTYNNRVIVYDQPERLTNRYWKAECKMYYPCGQLENGRKSKNYKHFNSILIRDGKILLVAHNESYKTGNPSEVVTTDMNFKVTEMTSLKGSNCHNIVTHDNQWFFCRSLEGTFAFAKKEVEVGTFTRGLALSDDWILAGGSTKATDASRREGQSGYLYFFKPGETDVKREIEIPSTQINEIRRVDREDFGLSISVPQHLENVSS